MDVRDDTFTCEINLQAFIGFRIVWCAGRVGLGWVGLRDRDGCEVSG